MCVSRIHDNDLGLEFMYVRKPQPLQNNLVVSLGVEPHHVHID